MKLTYSILPLELFHPWKIASSTDTSGASQVQTVVLRLDNNDGLVGIGEAPTTERYEQPASESCRFLEQVDGTRLSFDDIQASMDYLHSLDSGYGSAKSAVNTALLDGASRQAGQAVYDFLGLGFREGSHLTSYSIGIASPEEIRTKVLEAAPYPILKLKLGSGQDGEMLQVARDAAPEKTFRIDANEAWVSPEEALRKIERLAGDKRIEFVEQPMPATSSPDDLKWLRDRSPLPIIADESFHTIKDVSLCADCFHGVNAKLVKTGGVTHALDALTEARRQNLKTMIGCMIESSISITAACHLAALADYLDVDGHLLIRNDPYHGVDASNGLLSFKTAPRPDGLRVAQTHYTKHG
jgi:L-alanine-DL-glutamate epimerase-like enolase superfamily enzyme